MEAQHTSEPAPLPPKPMPEPSAETLLKAVLRRIGGAGSFTVNELARAEQRHLDQTGNGHTITLTVTDR